MSTLHLGTIKAGVGEEGTVKVDDNLRVNGDVEITGAFTSEVRMQERLILEKGADLPANFMYPDPFPSIFHERGYEVMTTDGPINGKITTYNGAVNVQGYNHWTTTWNYHYMNQITPMTKTYNVPYIENDNYAVIEFPITPNEHNALWVLDARSGWSDICGWLVHPDTGAPIKLLNYSVSNSRSNSYSGAVLFPGPDGEKDHPERYHDWLMFPIHRDDVQLYKTANDTIKMAVLPGADHAYGYMHISGLASTLNPWGITWQKHLQNGSWNPYGHTQALANYGFYDESYMSTIGGNASYSGFKLKIFNKENDILVGVLQHKGSNFSGNVEWTISGTAERFYQSTVSIGRLAKCVEGMNASNVRRFLNGFIIPAPVVQQHVQVDPKGFEYISFDLWNRSGTNYHPFAFYTEDILP